MPPSPPPTQKNNIFPTKPMKTLRKGGAKPHGTVAPPKPPFPGAPPAQSPVAGPRPHPALRSYDRDSAPPGRQSHPALTRTRRPSPAPPAPRRRRPLLPRRRDRAKTLADRGGRGPEERVFASLRRRRGGDGPCASARERECGVGEGGGGGRTRGRVSRGAQKEAPTSRCAQSWCADRVGRRACH